MKNGVTLIRLETFSSESKMLMEHPVCMKRLYVPSVFIDCRVGDADSAYPELDGYFRWWKAGGKFSN